MNLGFVKQNRETYIERMYELKKEKGYIRAVDLAKIMGVKPSSVTEMLRKLSGEGLVIYEKYRIIDLTPKGVELAKKLEERHRAIRKLLVYVGVDEKTADEDACKIEHVISKNTAKKIIEFSQKL